MARKTKTEKKTKIVKHDTGADLPAVQDAPTQRPVLSAETLGIFDQRPVSPRQAAAMDAIKSNAIDLFNAIQDAAREFGDNRRFSIAKTQLEDAVMWANKAIAHKS